MEHSNNSNQEEDYKIVLSYVKDFFANKRVIFAIIILFLIIGVIKVLVSPKVYQSSVTFITQSANSSKGNSGLGGIASLLSGGKISSNSGNNSDIPTFLYPRIMESLPFQRKLYETPLKLNGSDSLISFKEYALEIEKPPIKTTIAKYTVGLPGLLFGSKSPAISAVRHVDSLEYENGEEKKIIASLQRKITLTINEDDGTLQILATLVKEPIAAAQLAQSAQKILQNEIIRYRVSQAKEKYDFIDRQYEIRKKQFEDAQARFASYSDRNLFNTTQSSLITKTRLESEAGLLYSIYSDLEQQRLAQSIKIQEDTPTFTTINPAIVPLKSQDIKPLQTVFIFGVLGFIIAIIRYVFVVGWLYVKSLWSEI